MDLLEGKLKKFQYRVRVWQDVYVHANDLDEAIERAYDESLDDRNFDVIGVTPTGISEDRIDRNDIHSNN